ncbi:TetR/AcrR family transcriptional regulator [Mariprofundus erugo]|uniref:TetR/AcrR family transcriptional regulator n=2 Tax=Mariprofundus erugo TaxID=2528639 RepID=A0A5R9GLU0_9PROT|nr:TetR/AcrR family transcriptional regulator [Mariprofundus erugo]TLS78444.1 TetR/AcrR family transcriptional regulator [Mariprofundus erugo]
MSLSTAEKIIRVAEAQVRSGGYNAFSFREISKEIGIKSASIHYHFPTKADLGLALANRYTDRFTVYLNQIACDSEDLSTRLHQYIELFRHAIQHDKKMCLCGMLASEADVLPFPVQQAVKVFFEANLQWLELFVFADEPDPHAQAMLVLSCLEGALLVSKAMNDATAFDLAVNQLMFSFRKS